MIEKFKINIDKELYTIAIMRYKAENPNLNYNLLSLEWNISQNYRLKSIIVADAIRNHILIEETELYKKNYGD